MLFSLYSNAVFASHIAGGEIKITHIDSFSYALELNYYGDLTGIPGPPTVQISTFQREGMNQVQTFSLPFINNQTLSSSIPGCPIGLASVANDIYRDTIILNPNIFNHPGGYIFAWISCCRNGAPINIFGSGNGAIITLFPPVTDSIGNQIINSTPDFSTPLADRACLFTNYSRNFAGIDVDGDSLDYVLYAPMDGTSMGAGVTTPLTSPYVNPISIFGTQAYVSGYSVNDLIHGFPGPNPSPNRLKIDQFTGELSVTPIGPAGIYGYGIWCREYRNGLLIGSVFRELQMGVENCGNIQNRPPTINTPINQTLSTWNGDTLEFTGSPVCVQINVADSDLNSTVLLELINSEYDSQDIQFLQDSFIINNSTVSTALCFHPDTFLPRPSFCQLIARNPGCFNTTSDTLSFWINFINTSNAGTGGNFSYRIDQSQAPIDLFSLLGDNPNPGGIWIDLDNSNLLNANNQFIAQNVFVPSTFKFQYIDQQPNYPAHTAELELEFFIVQSLGESFELSKVSIYPNPSKGFITLKVTDDLVNKTVKVYTLESREVQRFNLDSNTNTISIEKSGMYLIKIEGNSKVYKVFIEN